VWHSSFRGSNHTSGGARGTANWAAQYRGNDILRYSRASRETGIGKGEYARVTRIEAEKNLLTVARADGSVQSYDPRRQMGVTVYREQEKAFSQGGRIQFTAPSLELKIVNRELGTVDEIASNGEMKIMLDSGKRRALDPKQYAHLDHGYAVTSHSSQGQTADRVLIHVDTDLAAKDLLNNRMAYVSVSRGQWDTQIFTNDRRRPCERARPRRFAPERVSTTAGYCPSGCSGCRPGPRARPRSKYRRGFRNVNLNGRAQGISI
jgi:hypothetical protein